MARGFGTGEGVGATDRIAYGNYAAINDLDTMTYAIWAYRTGNGGNNNGRMLDKRNANADGGAVLYTTASDYIFEAHRWQTNNGGWTITRPSGNVWVRVLVTYDHGSDANVPIFYFNGIDQGAPTETSAPSGTLASETETLVIGNNTNTNRNWDGRLAEPDVWDVILTSEEALADARGVSPLKIRRDNLVFYPPVWGILSPEPNFAGNRVAGTVTGTARVNHPPITPFTPKWAATMPLIEAVVAAEIPAARPAWNYRLHA